ncbi:MAG TPA: tetratricopeptide repeat protein [Kofleriaceae bacterium]
MTVYRIVALALLVSAPAVAQPNQADAEFKRGKALMAQNKYAEACAAFDKSQQLEPNVSVILNQANCREKNGQLATARELFLEAAKQTQRATDAKHVQLYNVSVERAAKLNDRVPSLTIDVPEPSRVMGLTVKRNGSLVSQAAWGTGLLLDGGTYVVEASAPDRKPWTETVTLATEKDRKTVAVPVLEAIVRPDVTPPDATKPDATKPDPTKPDPTKPDPTKADPTKRPLSPDMIKPEPAMVSGIVIPPPPRPSRTLPIIVGVAGVALVATSVGFLVAAGSTYDKARLEGNDAKQDDLWKSANTKRYVAEVTGIAGVAAIGVGVVLFLRTGGEEPRVQPSVSTDHASLLWSGRF